MLDAFLSLLAIAIAVVGASIQLSTYLRSRHDKATAESVAELKAPAERDSIIVGSASTAVTLLEHALNATFAENERLRQEIESLRAGADEEGN